MDEEIEIINTNTRIEKLKNFLISKRKPNRKLFYEASNFAQRL